VAAPMNMPDEVVQGLFSSAQSLGLVLSGLRGGGALPAEGAGAHAATLPELQLHYWQQQSVLWMGTMARATGVAVEPVAAPGRGDRRFNAEAWRNNPWFSAIKQTYLLNSRLLDGMVDAAHLDPAAKHKAQFYAHQFIDSMSPANFAATNPEAIKLAFETNGESLRAGVGNLLEDLARRRISITDDTAFEIGRNVAVSSGSVVFENPLFQLIQYTPLTAKVALRPLLIVPPCINKFYILDLQPDNSFVRYACEEGQTVFLVSWVNPGAELGKTTWDDYIEQGVMKAVEVASAISGADKVNAVGWCVGGTILASALAVMRARGDESVASVTLLTTLLDCSEPGDLGVFIDEQGVAKREQEIGHGGIYQGAELGFVFQMLRANDLIWPYVVSNYLEGKSPDAFDLLYWNCDSTDLPGPMYCWYLRNLYLENNLCIPGRLTVCGTGVDLGKIDMPSYVLATQDDHIVPWRSAYRTTRLLGGKTQFVLGASGHIAGVINPPSKNKRSHWINGVAGDDTEAWLASAKALPGSWWPHWMKWLQASGGRQVPARTRLGGAGYKSIEPAPGRYVSVRRD